MHTHSSHHTLGMHPVHKVARDATGAPPSFVGSNYYCESAYNSNDKNCFVNNVFFPNDPLWDGQQCDSEGTCCTGANTPPWFSVELSHSTSDDIEVRNCQDEETTNEDSPIQLLEVFVQYFLYSCRQIMALFCNEMYTVTS